MSFFNRRRSEFDRAAVGRDEQLNLTNYDERTVIPTESVPPVMPVSMQPIDTSMPATSTVSVPVGTAQPVPPPPTERPMVFVSREHPGIYIYEYSDRLEYYMRTNTCMHKFDTVKKV